MSMQHQPPSTVQSTKPRPLSAQAPLVNGQTTRSKARHSMILSQKTVLTTANIFQTGAEQPPTSPAQTCELRGTDHILHRYIANDQHPALPEFRIYSSILNLRCFRCGKQPITRLCTTCQGCDPGCCRHLLTKTKDKKKQQDM
ncbi:hypothetical protein EC991_009657 [Linnemannia zychae]|nr:hypothetical protein EC991_009657 [Linnemannia zychae]